MRSLFESRFDLSASPLPKDGERNDKDPVRPKNFKAADPDASERRYGEVDQPKPDSGCTGARHITAPRQYYPQPVLMQQKDGNRNLRHGKPVFEFRPHVLGELEAGRNLLGDLVIYRRKLYLILFDTGGRVDVPFSSSRTLATVQPIMDDVTLWKTFLIGFHRYSASMTALGK